jgi:hypothetical protein
VATATFTTCVDFAAISLHVYFLVSTVIVWQPKASQHLCDKLMCHIYAPQLQVDAIWLFKVLLNFIRTHRDTFWLHKTPNMPIIWMVAWQENCFISKSSSVTILLLGNDADRPQINSARERWLLLVLTDLSLWSNAAKCDL